MKKITSLLMLLFVFLGVANAEVNAELTSKKITIGADATSLTNGQWYVMYSHGRGACVSEETTAFKMRNLPANDDLAQKVAGKLFKFVAVESEEDQFYIVSGNGLYFDFINDNSSSVSESPVAYIVKNIGENDVHFYIQHADNGYVADGQAKDNDFVCYHKDVPAKSGGNNCYHLKPVTLTEVSLRDVTYNYYVGGALKHQEIVTDQIVGSPIAAPTFGFVSFTAPNGTVNESENVYDIACTLEDTPLTFSTIDAPVWQTVEMHRYGSFRIWDYESNDAPVKVTEMGANKMGVVEDSKLWCFVGNHFAFRIYNKKAGFDVTLNATNGNPKVGQASDNNDKWFFAKSTASSDDNVCCFISRNTSYMNRTANGTIGYYGSADNGSTCYFESPSVHFEPAAEEFNTILKNYEVPVGVLQNAIGMITPTAEQIEDFETKVSKASKTIDDMQELLELANAIKNTAAPVKAGYYFIKATGTGNNADWYLTHKMNNGKECVWAQAPDKTLNADYIWKFESSEGGYKMQCVNVGKYFQLKTATNNADNNTYITDDINTGNKMQFTNDLVGRFSIKNEHTENIRTEGNGQVNYWSSESNETWYIIPATAIDITIGEAGYATTYLPFDVTLPNTVKAYAVNAIEGEYAKMEGKTDIPANTGAILEGEGTHTLTIAEATSDWTGNKLEGTSVNTYVGKGAYVLAKPTIDEVAQPVGFYKATLNKNADGETGTTHFLNNANKAYLPASAGTGNARFISFDFGTETAIDELKGENGNVKTVIYDLSGRRVQGAQKGIFIVNGKKVVK